ncbi:hypothetical protein DSO57_1021756 [Entomophthora muscae]|uniref:Uncharacterized protein n=1 Tax=Entomophthora muscae TaxID=34485 RepID=A0ACC2RUB7_9FUNG|nr:hypothetical protein DSO57_1021756 [Entomophthora muscae]
MLEEKDDMMVGFLAFEALWEHFGSEIDMFDKEEAVKFQGPPLALDRDIFPRPSKKAGRVQAKPLQNLEDLAHTEDKRFVLAFTAKPPSPSLEFPLTTDETLIQLDFLLSWCHPVLKQLEGQQENTGHIVQGLTSLYSGKIGDKIPQSAESWSSKTSGQGVPQPKVIGFRSIPVVTSKAISRGNVTLSPWNAPSQMSGCSLHMGLLLLFSWAHIMGRLGHHF